MGIIFKQSFKNTLIIYLAFLIGGINTIILYPTFLKAEYYGLVTYVFSAANLIMPLSALGVQYTIVKFFSAYKEREQQDRFMLLMLLFPLFISIPLGLLWSNVHNWIMQLIPKENKIIENYTIYIYIVAVACAYFEVFYSWAKVQLQSVFGNLLKEIWNRLFVCLFLFLVFFDLITRQEFIIYMSGAYVIRTVVMMLYAFKLHPPVISFKLPNNYKEVILYTFYIVLSGSASAVILDIDKVMIPGKEVLQAAAYYSVAVFIGSFIEAPSRAMTQILQPMTSKSINENNTVEVENLYKKSSINLLLIGGLFFLLVNCNIAELFKIMPDKGYADGVLVVLMISLAKLFLMFLGNNNAIIGNSKYYKITLPIGLGMAFSVYFLNKWLLELMGTNGVALSTLITILVFNGFKFWFVSKKFKMTPVTSKTGLLLGTIIILFLTFYFWHFTVPAFYLYEIPIHPIINIILKSIIIVVVYIYIALKLNISEQVTNLVSKILRKYKLS